MENTVMERAREFFGGKKITLVGLGLLGRGVGDAEFLAECGADLIVTDLKTKEQLESSLERLSFYKNITYVLGEHRFEDFEGRDMVIKAAGVPFDSPYIAEAKKNGIPVYMSGALFAKLSGLPIIAVTGSRGKSTTTGLIHHALVHGTLNDVTNGGLDHSEGMVGRTTLHGKVVLGGNVRGVSNLQLLKDVEEGDIAVMELDSWQLQGFGDLKLSPHIAVFTSFLPDHMDYYKNDMDAYFDDKALIFTNQGPGDVFVTTPDVFKYVEAYAARTGYDFVQEVILTDASDVPVDWSVPIPGDHNLSNVALAIAALRETGLGEGSIREGIESFSALPGRLQYLGETRGVKIYNDNNATSPHATLAGLKAVADKVGPPSASRRSGVVIIMGGSDKKLDMEPLLSELPNYAKEVVLLPGTGTDTIADKLPSATRTASMRDAVEAAFARAEAGDVILLSPAFASFGLFRNEYDRNDQFVNLIKEKMTAQP